MTGRAAVTPPPAPRLDEIGLENFAPYLMNRIMGRYNASLRQELAALGLTTPQMRALAVLSVRDGPLIRDLAVYAIVPSNPRSAGRWTRWNATGWSAGRAMPRTAVPPASS